MQFIFSAVGYYDFGGASCAERTVVACFTDRTAAEEFCKETNDAIQATELEVEESACVDNYGYPVSRAEWVAVCGGEI